MENSTAKQITDAAEAIERYLATRPLAAETVEGVARWWLARQRLDDAVDLVQRALDHLVGRGVVEQIALSGGKPIYRRAAAEITEAHRNAAHSN